MTTQRNTLTTKPILPAGLVTRMLVGGGIALLVIVFFLVSAGTPKPEWGWGEFYWVKSVIITPLVGAMGGVFCHFMEPVRNMDGWKKAAGYIVSVLGYIVSLWLGSVLGLNGTYWN